MSATRHRTYTIEQIKQANRDAGRVWFEPDTLRFFGTRVHAATYGPDSEGRVYFVSSEFTGFARVERAFTVRVFDPREPGLIDDHGGYLEHPTRSRAHAAARKAAREG